MNIDISVVIPTYQSAKTLPVLTQRLSDVLTGIGKSHEIIVVDDCSTDDTWAVLKELKQRFSTLRLVRLLRNTGQHNAILCGLGMTRGAVVITMDDDLQNLPEDVPRLLDAIEEGYDLVVGAYHIKKHSFIRNLGGKAVDIVQRHIFKLPSDFQLTSFRAIRKVVVDHVVRMGGTYPYITSMLLSHTSKYKNVPVKHEARLFGTSNYDTKRSFLLVFNLLLNYSSYPLYLVTALCLAALGFSIFLGSFVFWSVAVNGAGVQGWASTIVAIAFFNALTLIALTIQGLYLSRIAQEVSRSRISFSVGEVYD